MTKLPTINKAPDMFDIEKTTQIFTADNSPMLIYENHSPADIKQYIAEGKNRPATHTRLLKITNIDRHHLRCVDWECTEMREALVKMNEVGMTYQFLFILHVVAPLYKIIYYSTDYASIYSYVNIVKSFKHVRPIEFSSKDVYNFLNLYRKKRSLNRDTNNQIEVDNLLCYYYPQRTIFEKLKTQLDNEQESDFCETLANAEKEDIYKHCHYYKHIYSIFNSVCSRKDFTPIFSYDTHCIMKIVEDSGELFTYEYEDFVMQLLLDVESIIKPKGLAEDFLKLLDLPIVAKLYAEAKGCDSTPEPVDVLIRTDLDKEKRDNLVNLIVSYFSEETQQRKATKTKGVTIQSVAQKSVIKLLIETKCLPPSIDPFNATTLHHLMSLFIEEHIGIKNISYSSTYNKTKIFQEYTPKELRSEPLLSKKHERFMTLKEDIETNIKNN